VLQHLFAAMQQIGKNSNKRVKNGDLGPINEKNHPNKVVFQVLALNEILAETRGFEPPIRVLAPMLP
jgi:hypothetical protein